MILCCKCGIPIVPRLLNMCGRCITSELTLSQKIKRYMVLEHCRQCDRYLIPPRGWAKYTWGSRDFLMFLLKRNKTLNSLEIIDSNFIYTEENSKRIAVSVTILDQEVEQNFVIRYTIKNMQCTDCCKTEAKQHWNCLVQVRQSTKHKRTFMYLEQLVIKNKMLDTTSNIKERKNGIDFYYQTKGHASKMVEFIESVIGCKVKASERLISSDTHSNTAYCKFTFSVELVPLCKDDLVILDNKVANKLGCGTLMLIGKVACNILLLDPLTSRTVKITSRFYWENNDKIHLFMSSGSLTKFTVAYTKFSKEKLSEATLMYNNNDAIECNTHLKIKEDDVVYGYDVMHANLSIDVEITPVVLVRNEPKLDRVWKSHTYDINDLEFLFFVEDIEKDNEIMENLCENIQMGIDVKLEKLRMA